MANVEKHVLSASSMAIDEINQKGGVLGRQVQAIIEDGQSVPELFAQKAEKLIKLDRVSTIFGCWTSSSRKAVKPVVEKHQSLLWYPIQYEGLEQSEHIIYTGSCLNQQIYPAITWALSQGWRNAFLIGSDYVFPRTANSLIRALVVQGGGTIVDERYVPLDVTNFEEIVALIRSKEIDIVFNTINGDGNLAFFKECAKVGLDAREVPILSFSFSEIELASIKKEAAGHFACWSYFQGANTAESIQFTKRYHQSYGDHMPVADPIVTAYTQIYLWKYIVEVVKSFEPLAILQNAAGMSVSGPGGLMEIQPNRHVCKPALIGQAQDDGLFRVVWESDSPIAPKPWLGIEDVNLSFQNMIHDAMERYPEVVHLNWRLEQEIMRRQGVEELLQGQVLRLHQLTQAVEQSPVSVVITDSQGDIIYVNPQFKFLTGYSSKEALGKNPNILKSGLTPRSTYREMWATILSGKTWRGEFLNKKKNGELYWELAVIAPLLDSAGEIINFISVKVDITPRKQSEAALQAANQQLEVRLQEIEHLQAILREQAIRDPLTKLYNRRYLNERLESEIHYAVRYEKSLSVILVDIDHFKAINDTYGHDAGDIFLMKLAKLLQKGVRKSDIIYRYGGEEFLLVLLDCNDVSAAQYADNLRQTVANTRMEYAGQAISATISLGVASYPVHGSCYSEIIRKADQAMYTSKRAGRNRVTVWSNGEVKP